MIELLAEPFQYEFMRRALIGVVLVGAGCSLIGVYVVLRRLAFIGDALAHTALPGVMAAHFLKGSYFLGALATAVVTAVGVGMFSRQRQIREDTAIGILFTAMFAFGLFLMNLTRSYRDFTHILFGDVLGLSLSDLAWTAAIDGVVFAVLWLLHKEFELASVDPAYAEGIGLKPHRVRLILLVLVALAVVTGIQAVGVVLTSALLITPAATAALLSHRLKTMMLLAVCFGILSGVVGLYLSYYARVGSGPAIVLVCTLLFLAVWAIQSVRRTQAG
jgi:manganese/iron transport system permease protein